MAVTVATSVLTTADELLQMPDDGMRYELVRGELLMMSPAGARHGRLAVKVGGLLFDAMNARPPAALRLALRLAS